VPGGASPGCLPYCVTKEEAPIAWQATHPPPKPTEPEASRSPHTLYFDHSFTMALWLPSRKQALKEVTSGTIRARFRSFGARFAAFSGARDADRDFPNLHPEPQGSIAPLLCN
jgi:hypothetical protein